MTLPNSTEAPPQSKPWLTIVGIGQDGVGGLGLMAQEAIAAAKHVFGGRRHLELAASLIKGRAIPWPHPFDVSMADVLALRGAKVCVLATGDPFHFGVGVTLAKVVQPQEMIVYPAPSAFSLAAARLGWALQDVTTLSLHASPVVRLRRHLQPGRRILALTAGADAPRDIAGLLVRLGFGASVVTVLEAIGGPREHISRHPADAFPPRSFDALNIVGVETAADGAATRILPASPGLPDDWFATDGQITKRDIRALTLAALAPRHGELLWDIGAGSGSISIEWLLSGTAMRACAIEPNAARAAFIGENVERFGVAGLALIEGRAPDALGDQPAPDAIFIGGGGTVAGVTDAAIERLKPGGRIVANAVTMEMEALLLALHQRLGGNLIRVAIARAAPLGGMTGWRPALPVTQWSWWKL